MPQKFTTTILITATLIAILLNWWIGPTQAESLFQSPIPSGYYATPIIFSLTPFPPTPTPTRYPDTTPPETTVNLAGENIGYDWYRSPVTITIEAEDDLIGMGISLYKLNNAPDFVWVEEEFGQRQPITATQEGLNNLSYYSIDRYGNTESLKSTTVNIDLTAPASAHPTIAGAAGANGWHISPLTITLTAIDGQVEVDYIEYDWQQNGWQTYTTPIAMPSEGVHHLAFRAVDKTGHIEATKWFTAMVDLSPPLVTIQPVPVMTLSHIILTDIYTATDDVSGINTLTATIGGQPVQTGQKPPLGTNTLLVTAVNRAGLQNTASQSIVVEGVNLYLPLIFKSSPPCDPPFCW